MMKITGTAIPIPTKKKKLDPSSTEPFQDFAGMVKLPLQSLKKIGVPVKPLVESCCKYFSPRKCEFYASNFPTNWEAPPNTVGYGVAGALWAAYNNHCDVVLSPDDVWLTIVHGFSMHVNFNAKKLRKYFVSHTGKKDLEVTVDENPQVSNNWDEAITKFQKALNGAVNADAAKLLECNFSTTGPIEKAVSGIGAMSSFQKYFNYICYTLCGIRSVYFTGKLEDWKNLKTKLGELKKFECDKWVERLTPIIDKFIEGYTGVVDLGFWNKVAHIEGPDHGSGKTCATLTGWITAFFPYESSGDQAGPSIDLPNIPEPIFTVPFVLIPGGPGGPQYPYEFKGGFTGVLYENEAFRPQLSYAVLKPEPAKPEKKKHF